MKTDLRQITMDEFIRLECGDKSVLIESGEVYSDTELDKVADNVRFAYRKIASPAEAESALMNYSDEMKVKMKMKLASVLGIMNAMGIEDEVKGVLRDMGYGEVSSDKIPSVLDRMKAEAEYAMYRLGERKEDGNGRDAGDIAASYDAEVASLMTFYRMQIDITKMSASVYANMLYQANMQIRKLKIKNTY